MRFCPLMYAKLLGRPVYANVLTLTNSLTRCTQVFDWELKIRKYSSGKLKSKFPLCNFQAHVRKIPNF